MNFIPIHFNAETFRAGWDVPFLQMLFFLLFFNLRQARFLFVFLNKHRVSVFLYRNERVISNYPPCKVGNAQLYPSKLCLIEYELDIIVFVSLNCLFSFAGSYQKWLVHSLLIRRNTCWVRIMKLTYTFLIRLSFQGYRCISDIATFALRLQLPLNEVNKFKLICRTKF